MSVQIWQCIPFAGLLLCIALFPILKPDWWDHNKQWAVLFWSVLSMVLFTASFGVAKTANMETETLVNDYLTFIVLLFGLYCVAGNITFEGDLAGSPRVNVCLLIVGTLLSSCIGTTGSSMLMIRPVIKMNSWRRKRSHIMVFFIFLVSNMGGCLTPVGDPPLLMGFMRGVPFFWSLKLFPVLLFNVVLLLFLFYHIDVHYYRKDIASGLHPDISKAGCDLKIGGAHNLLFIVMIIAGVVLSGVLPGLRAFQNSDGSVKGLPLFAGVTLGLPAIIEILLILLAAALSFRTTDVQNRRKNHFTWSAIQEVAILFIGIFITMQPALLLLKAKGPELGITQAWQMFWSTGFLSSFLDNTPTYLVFLTTAGSLGFHHGILTTLGDIPIQMLEAISCGAVFMGANTYIGNAPNFMVKSISDENGIQMPSFFGYMKWSFGILIPVFLLDSLVFFL